jgi:hypothetical protein
MAPNTPRALTRWVTVAWVVAIAAVALTYTFIGREAGLRALGGAMIAGAGLQQWLGAIPYGWEGREPSGHLTGWGLTAFNLAFGLTGLAMLVSGKSPWGLL